MIHDTDDSTRCSVLRTTHAAVSVTKQIIFMYNKLPHCQVIAYMKITAVQISQHADNYILFCSL